MLDEEKMRPGHWLGSVLCIPFSTLTRLGDRKGIGPPILKGSLPDQVMQENWGKPADTGSLGKQLLKRRC